jgi:7-cyano-7-deazaguanine synthase
MKKKAIILLSGGVDSTTVLAIAKNEGYQPLTLSFDYGQRHSIELDKAQFLADKYQVLESQVMKIDLRQFGG